MGAPSPHLSLGDFGPRDTDKNGVCSGAIYPHLGFGCQVPQNGFFFIFFYFTKNPQNEFSFKFVSRQRYASSLITEILKKNLSSRFRENGVQIFGGRGTFSSSPTRGAPFPHLTLGDFGPMDSDKNVFCLGGIAPHLGEIWGLAGVHFGPLFLEIHSSDLEIFKPIASTSGLLSILRI